MIKTLECPHCGQFNHVDTLHFDQALCTSCKGPFSGLGEFHTYASNKEVTTALKISSAVSGGEKVDVNKWIAKIGGAAQQEIYVIQGLFKKLKKHASKIPFTKEAVAMYYCAVDSATPASAKVIAFGALAYLVMPLDLIPDLILALGYTDDAAAFWAAYKSISAHVTDEHRAKAEAWLLN